MKTILDFCKKINYDTFIIKELINYGWDSMRKNSESIEKLCK